MISPIDSAMVLAAGLGQRMRPITDTCPKPLVRIGGRAMLDHALDRLREAGIPAVVNARGAYRSIADGDLVRVDPARGEVRIVNRTAAPAPP